MDQDGSWHGGRPQPRQLYIRWGPIPSLKRGRSPSKFSAHVYCGKMAGWIKMIVGMEVGLCPDDIVLDGDPASLPKKGAEAPCQILAYVHCAQNDCMDLGGPWHGGGTWSTLHCAVWGPWSSSPKRGHSRPHLLPSSLSATTISR